MKILSIVGKVDSRALVYPLIRALSLNGLTGVITDDGSYRRLYHGKGNIGNVNGIDISVCGHVDDRAVHSLDNSGVPYDNLIIVSTDYIHPESTGIIACHGLDRSMMAKDEVEEEDDFIFPIKAETKEPEEAVDSKKKGGRGKKKPIEDSTPIVEDTTAEVASENTESTEEAVEEEPVVETEHDRIIRLQAENPDKIIVPDGVPYTEIQIAFAAVPKKGILGISLRDGLYSYVYNCEEQKRIGIIPDKNYNSLITKIVATPLGIPANEMSILLTKDEGKGAPEKGKKK